MKDFFGIVKTVLTDFRVIGTAAVCVILMNFAGFIARYRKSPPKQRVKKGVRPAAKPAAETSENSGGDNTPDESA